MPDQLSRKDEKLFVFSVNSQITPFQLANLVVSHSVNSIGKN